MKAVDYIDFDGEMFLQCVSEEKGYIKITYNQNFSDHASVNDLLKGGEWKDNSHGCVVPGIYLDDYKVDFADQHNLDDPIAD